MFAEDVGEYTCRATSPMGAAESAARIMPAEQYESWFADEQQQVTRERKQRALAAQRAQMQQLQGSRSMLYDPHSSILAKLKANLHNFFV